MTKMNIKFDYREKTVLVVGGSRGIGEQITKDFITTGAEVYYMSRNKNIDLEKSGAKHIRCDLRDENKISESFDKIESIDFLINSAAINFCKSVEDIDVDEWDDVFSVNVRSFYLTCKFAIEKMKKRRFGRIVNISSIAGRNKSVVSGSHYTASKSAIIGLTRQLAHEVSRFGINVNVTCPSQTMTDMLKTSMTKNELDKLCESIPISRIASTKEQSYPVLFLCSDAASYITGCVLDVNGGQL
jgi:NAD(P)-dependent dehydrogenase (short-subunit alcohol dehydrogenase family)